MKLYRYIMLCGVVIIGGLFMVFPKMSGTRSYSVKVPKLSGGINTSESPHLIDDNQLTDCLNMWWEDGALRSRRGLWTSDDELSQMRTDAISSDISISKIRYIKLGNTNVVDISGTDYDEINDLYELVYAHSAFDNNGSFANSPNFQIVTSNRMYAETNSSEISSALSGYNAIMFTTDGFSDAKIYGISGDTETDLSGNIYVPTVSINGNPFSTVNGQPNGKVNEEKNMLTSRFKATFTSDGAGIYYFLPFKNIDNTAVTVNWTDAEGAVTTFTVPAGSVTSNTISNRQIHFVRSGGYFRMMQTGSSYAIPAAGISNNIEVIADKSVPGSAEKICGMTFNTWFGGDASGLRGGTRLFVSGNPEFPNLIHWSAVNNSLYFPESNLKYIGGDSQKVTAFGKQSNMLVMFKERETYYMSFQSREITIEDIASGIFRTQDYTFVITPINAYIGCDVPNTVQLCANRLVWMNSNGKVYTLVSANQYNENTVRELSQNIETMLKSHDVSELVDASAVDYDGRYYLLIGNIVYVMDYRNNAFVYYGSSNNDEKTQRTITWFKWDVEISGVTWNRILGEGTQPVLCGEYESDDGTVLINYVFSDLAEYNDYTPDDETEPVQCMFSTKAFDFGNPSVMKNVSELYLGVGRESTGPTLTVTYITDRGELIDPYRLYSLKAPSGSGSAEYIDIRRLTPRLTRILRFGIKVESDKAMSVDSMELKYSLFSGGVR